MENQEYDLNEVENELESIVEKQSVAKQKGAKALSKAAKILNESQELAELKRKMEALKAELQAEKERALSVVKKRTEKPRFNITILAEKCPHPEGSVRAVQWEALLDCENSEDWKKIKGNHETLGVWYVNGYIDLEKIS